MENLLDFSGYLLESETPKWESGGIVLIKGKPNAEGKKPLYAMRIDKVVSAGNDHYRAFLNDESVYRIAKDGDKFVPRRVDFNPDYNKKFVGVSGKMIGLNDRNKKTPKWKKTISEKNIHKICSEVFHDPSEWEDIKF